MSRKDDFIAKMEKQEALMKKIAEPSVAMQKMMKTEAHITAIAASTPELNRIAQSADMHQSILSPELSNLKMDGIIEATRVMSTIPQITAGPHIPQVLQEIATRIDSITTPVKESQAALEGLRTFNDATLPMFSKPELMDFLESSKYLEAIPRAALDWYDFASPLMIISERLADCVAAISFDQLSAVLQNAIYPHFNFEKHKRQEQIFGRALNAAQWFPYIRGELFFYGFREINQILSESSQEELVTRIDNFVFSIYPDERIEKIKCDWSELGLPEHIYLIMKQAVDAYLREEYAVTTIVLSSLWEGIVARKATGKDTYRVSKKTIENFNLLISKNDLPAVCVEFYEANIMYTCHSLEDAKEDVPGRHANAHGWFSAYPTRKAALNAIIFTDFLFCVTESIKAADQ